MQLTSSEYTLIGCWFRLSFSFYFWFALSLFSFVKNDDCDVFLFAFAFERYAWLLLMHVSGDCFSSLLFCFCFASNTSFHESFLLTHLHFSRIPWHNQAQIAYTFASRFPFSHFSSTFFSRTWIWLFPLCLYFCSTSCYKHTHLNFSFQLNVNFLTLARHLLLKNKNEHEKTIKRDKRSKRWIFSSAYIFQ